MSGRIFPNLFQRSAHEVGSGSPSVAVLDQPHMALDAVAAILRTLGEFALEHPEVEPAAFARLCEQWAQHVLLATPAPPPGMRTRPDAATPEPAPSSRERRPSDPPPPDARRDWSGVRGFVREYCETASTHARSVVSDLRQVVWVFIQHLNHTLTSDQQADARITTQLGRIERLAGTTAATSELKREVLAAVVEISRLLEERRRTQRARLDELGARVSSLGQELDAARREAETDALTRIFNRRALDDYLARSVELVRAFGHDTCLLLLDVDRFKSVNDTYGHATGDDVLRRVADAASRTFLRRSDFVARYGGDELAVVLRETALRDAQMLAERLLKSVRNITIEQAGGLAVTISVGVARVEPGDDVTSWIARADRGLYKAKQEGRNRVGVDG